MRIQGKCWPQMIVLVAVVLLYALPNALMAQEKRPNILFIFSDDHACQAIGAYGSKINATPNIDRIAREGLLFENSFCANSICGPSRACILTGKHSHKNGFLRNGNRFDGQQTTFPPLLQKAGYQTALIGKWHLSTTPVGFDHWEILPGQGSYYNPDFLQMDGSRRRDEGYCTDLITDKALEWLKTERNPDKPFMLMCQHKAPHRNWSPPPRHFDLFPTDVPEPDSLMDQYSNRTALLKENEMSIRDHFHWGHDMKFHGENQFPESFASRHKNGEYRRMTDAQKRQWDAYYEPRNQEFIRQMKAGELDADQVVRWKYQRYIKDYLKCVAAVDDGIGRLLEYLDDENLAENTIVIYSSDQGFYLGEHNWYDKRWMFEESLKMPLAIRWPGKIAAGQKSTTLVQNIDYAPTFLNIAGAAVPEEMQGRSLMPLLVDHDNAAKTWRDAVYYAYYENASVHAVPIHDGVRSDRYKLMFFPRGRQWQLFDLVSDPQELQSVHADPNYSNVLQAMKKRYRDMREFYEVNSATIPQTRGDEAWWRERDRAKTAEAKQGVAELAFIGDSITQSWEGGGKQVWQEFYSDRKPINLGFSGDRTEHVIWRLQHGNFRGITPQVAVVMIGTNNTGHQMQNPKEVAAGIEKIVSLIQEKSPDTKILLLGVFPRGREAEDHGRLNNIAINQIIRRLGNDQDVHYLDIGNVFIDEEGRLPESLMPDALHLSPEGYRLWATAIEAKLKEFGI